MLFFTFWLWAYYCLDFWCSAHKTKISFTKNPTESIAPSF